MSSINSEMNRQVIEAPTNGNGRAAGRGLIATSCVPRIKPSSESRHDIGGGGEPQGTATEQRAHRRDAPAIARNSRPPPRVVRHR